MHFFVVKLKFLLLSMTQTIPDCGPAGPGDRGDPTSKSGCPSRSTSADVRVTPSLSYRGWEIRKKRMNISCIHRK